jgi:hypothetical protein
MYIVLPVIRNIQVPPVLPRRSGRMAVDARHGASSRMALAARDCGRLTNLDDGCPVVPSVAYRGVRHLPGIGDSVVS